MGRDRQRRYLGYYSRYGVRLPSRKSVGTIRPVVPIPEHEVGQEFKRKLLAAFIDGSKYPIDDVVVLPLLYPPTTMV